MTELAERTCVPCRGGVPPLTPEQVAALLTQVEGWKVVENHHLAKRYGLKNFAEALALVNRIGAIAEEQGHHPDLALAWGRVEVEIWTHKIDGLTESDFILAAKCDQVYRGVGAAPT
jgi:4a-hydroxytetrahydrobiopterin dehydratase